MPEVRDPIGEQLAAARRNQILDAATVTFAEKGFHRTTIRDVARSAGVADGTIYNYFGSKDDLLLGILDRLNETEDRDARFAQGAEEDPAAFFAAYLRHRMSIVWPNAEVFRAVLPEILVSPKLRDQYYGQVIGPTMAIAERYFGAQMEQGSLRRLDPALTSRSIAATILGLLLLQLLGDEELAARREELPDVLAALLFDGLRAPGSGERA